MLPQSLREEIEARLGANIADVMEVSGGCISNTARITTTTGDRVFLKWGDEPDMFHAEADGLAAMSATRTVRVPAVIAVDSWLLTEWLEPGPIGPAQAERLGRNLAGLHRNQNEAFGWFKSNYIGSLPQSNAWSRDWPSFWRDQRILPQAQRLAPHDRARVEKLLDRAIEIIAPGNAEGASLLHGDLWNGNVHGVREGDAAVIDPSAYYGHREVDLAMAMLFGGFDARFFDAYKEAWPVSDDFERRVYFYQLYYMLVHVNLFGGSYLNGTMSLVGKLGF